ncbi:MAG: aminotransferase class V-fold PLP-dependent enzyme [Lutisporaceae bacterium]
MMNRVYLDNAATTFPKAPRVGEVMKDYIENVGTSIKRGVYQSALSVEETVFETREMLCNLFNFDKPDNVVFTMNITQSMNYLIKGLLKPGDHCIVSSMEHNAVMRPLSQMTMSGVSFSRVICDQYGRLRSEDILERIRPETKAVIMTHASNVCGTVLPLEAVGRICSDKGLLFIVDAAQSAGILEVDYKALNADAIAFTGHKGLLGPQGIGGFLINDKVAANMASLICGGTGSDSEYEEQPEYMPDKFEAGTPNIPGIIGLHRALEYIKYIGISTICDTELKLTGQFLEGVQNIEGIRVIGLKDTIERTAVVSLDFEGLDNGEVSYLLDRDFGIMTRCGLHCAPSAHKTLGTFPNGTVRFSFSHSNTIAEVLYTIDAINKVIKG